jgi:hypothetical protein
MLVGSAVERILKLRIEDRELPVEDGQRELHHVPMRSFRMPIILEIAGSPN